MCYNELIPEIWLSRVSRTLCLPLANVKTGATIVLTPEEEDV